jgi:hypothetical protein
LLLILNRAVTVLQINCGLIATMPTPNQEAGIQSARFRAQFEADVQWALVFGLLTYDASARFSAQRVLHILDGGNF